MKSKRASKNRCQTNLPAWADRTGLERLCRSGVEKLARHLQHEREASIRSARLRATALSPVAAVVRRKWPEILDAGRVGLEKVRRQLNGQPPVRLDQSPQPAPQARHRRAPDPVFSILGCRLPPYDDETKLSLASGKADKSTGRLQCQIEAVGQTAGKFNELHANPAVGIYYQAESPGMLVAKITATVSARIFKGAVPLFGDASADLWLHSSAYGMDPGLSANYTIIYPDQRLQLYELSWGIDIHQFSSRTYEVIVQRPIYGPYTSVVVWAILYAHVMARGSAVARIDCSMNIDRICVDME